MTEFQLLRLESCYPAFPNATILPLSGLLERLPQAEHAHKRDFFLLIFLLEGHGNLVVDNQTIVADRSKVIFVKPSAVLKYQLNRSARGYLIGFRDELFSLRYNDNILKRFDFMDQGSHCYIRLDDQRCRRWVQLIEWMNLETTMENRSGEKVFRSYLNICLFDIDRSQQSATPSAPKDISYLKAKNFEELVDAHYRQWKKPSQYANQMNITSNYLNKICKDIFQQTAGTIIRQRVTIEAKRLLLHTPNTVSQVADMLGFESVSYFVAFFRKYADTTPEQFRKQQAG